MSVSIPSKDEIIQQEILQAALQLFQKYGLYKVTMDDVAKAIGKGRSSLYYYYKSRDEIFEAVMATFIGEIMLEISQSIKEAVHVKQQLQAFCRAKLQTSEKRRAIYRALENGMGAQEISKHTLTMNIFHNQMMEQEEKILVRVIQQGIENEEIRSLSDKEIEMFIFLMLSSIRGIKRELNLNNDFYKMEDVVSYWTDIVFKSLEI